MKKSNNIFSTTLSLLFGNWRLLLPVATAVAVAIALLLWLNRDNSISISTSNDSISISPTKIESIRNIGEWEFLAISDEEIVDTVRRGFFGDDCLARIYYGTLRLGINMKETKPHWLTVSNDTVVARLPKIKLLDEDFIDETRTRAFFAEGTWKPADYKVLYNRAYDKMRRRCLTEENIKNAEHNAVEQFTTLLNSMGYRNVRVELESATGEQPEKQ